MTEKSNIGCENTPSQYQKFIETARKLECDEDEARFKEKLGKIVKAKPVKDNKAE